MHLDYKAEFLRKDTTTKSHHCAHLNRLEVESQQVVPEVRGLFANRYVEKNIKNTWNKRLFDWKFIQQEDLIILYNKSNYNITQQ